jgi:hypothetical protein
VDFKLRISDGTAFAESASRRFSVSRRSEPAIASVFIVVRLYVYVQFVFCWFMAAVPEV